MTAALVTFLHARLNDDEQVARAAKPGPWIRHDHVAGVHADDATPDRPHGSAVADCRRVPDGHGVPNALHIVRHQPARVLADVAAKRRIVDDYAVLLSELDGLRMQMRVASAESRDDNFMQMYQQEGKLIEKSRHLAPVIRSLALPYADHPDYQVEWRP
ncbi:MULTISPECIES: DUF6221 family protein [Streptomyces]|uniref:DUF6221 family protein n=1 Tax=Streptomyces TaxID=1883 RepID=UPI00345BDB6D